MARGEFCRVNTLTRLISQLGVAAKTRRDYRSLTDSHSDLSIASVFRGSRIVRVYRGEASYYIITYGVEFREL